MSIAALVHARLPTLRAHVLGRRVDDVDVLHVPPAHLSTIARFLRDDPDVGCDHFVDVTAIDHGPEARAEGRPRFVVVVLLASRAHGTRVRLDVPVDDDDPCYPSLAELWPAALLAERELWEMFGITAEGHPSLRRFLLPEGFAGHPGRLDYRLEKAQPQTAPPTREVRVVIDGASTTSPATGGRA